MSDLPREQYVVNVGPNGTFQMSGNYQTSPEKIDSMFANFRTNNVGKIVLYFHGGLVNERSGLESAERVKSYIQKSGSAPVCFVWETGLVETISNNISKISQTKLFNKLVKLILKKAIQVIGFDSHSSRGKLASVFTDEQIDIELLKSNPFGSYDRSAVDSVSRSAMNLEALNLTVLASELQSDLEAQVIADREFVSLIGETKLTVLSNDEHSSPRGVLNVAFFIKHVVNIVVRTVSRFQKKRDHDLYPTIVEEILREFYVAETGAWIWKSMKDRAGYMWNSNIGKQGMHGHAGRYFLEKLADYKNNFPETKISVIGHSAGAIAICHLLSTTAALEYSFQFEHVIFLAPACTVDLFKREVLNRRERFRNFRLFKMSDENECKDLLVPFFYTHSLLYLVSGILEDEGESYDSYILGLARHTEFNHPYDIDELKELHLYLNEHAMNREVLSVTEEFVADGLGSHARKHGGFDDDEVTLMSIVHILK